MFKMMMTAAFAVATLGVPATAQTTGSGSMGGTSTSGTAGGMGSQSDTSTSGSMGGMGAQSGSQSGSMASDTAMGTPKMTKAQMASAKKCQAMDPARMAKNKTCMKMQKMHPEMMSSGAM